MCTGRGRGTGIDTLRRHPSPSGVACVKTHLPTDVLLIQLCFDTLMKQPSVFIHPEDSPEACDAPHVHCSSHIEPWCAVSQPKPPQRGKKRFQSSRNSIHYSSRSLSLHH
ncbi:hypothetical protein E2C01_020062 [Portunus trituberculatus]|uniref:Uncharacterized protein n=1 Tax=Portunus trituberculatus TaxID=210409 RepID=A0A5B7DZ75_PORTR|nr:hypothetical protein [Portunus trituberculatus]